MRFTNPELTVKTIITEAITGIGGESGGENLD